MKKVVLSMLFSFGLMPLANAGMFDGLVDAANNTLNQVKEATKAKEMVRVELPLKAIKKNDSRIKRIESLAIQVAMKHKWNLQIACPGDEHCKKLKKDVDAEAWRMARSKVSSDYAAKSKLPKIQVVQARNYHLILMRKGF